MRKTKLKHLRSRLSRLRRRREILRVGIGMSSLLLAVLLAAAALFLADWILGMDRLQRGVALAITAALLFWAFRRFTLPWLGQRETLLEVALLVERRERIDSDLVASLEFESPEADRWGSRELEGAVIDSVAKSSKGLRIFRGFSWKPLLGRMAVLSLLLLILGGLSIRFPGHRQAFLNRILLGASRYPTRCVIEEISINGIPVRPAAPGAATPRIPLGRAVAFGVRARGELPSGGEVELKSLVGGLKTTLHLGPVRGPGWYEARLPRLIESVTYGIYLGDDWTDPEPLLIIPLPVVDLVMEAESPSYASAAGSGGVIEGARQISVIEGSRITVGVLSRNKRLREARLNLGEARIPLAASGEDGRLWRLDPAGTPLERVVDPISFQVQVADEDGLELDEPLHGFIRIKPDRPPRVAAGVITRYVLPRGKPKLAYHATDDHGLASLRIHFQVSRPQEEGEVSEEVIPLSGPPPHAELRGDYILNLDRLKLLKDDQVTITLEATDFRGNLPGKSALSEPLVLHITDERGVLAAMMETDEESAQQLDAIIQKELGIGESK